MPLGALLSGGIDSSIVVSAMAQASSEPVRTFTVGFPTPYDERRYARAVAERYGTRHEEIEIEPAPAAAALARRLRRAVRRRGRPADSCSSVRRRAGTSRSRSSATVATRSSAATSATARTRLPTRVPHVAAARGVADARGDSAGAAEPRSTLFRARRFLDVAAAPAAERYGTPVEVFPLELRRRLWTDERARTAARGCRTCRAGGRPAARRHRVVPARRSAAEGRPRLDGGLARAALAVPRSPRRRARACTARPRAGGSARSP